MAMHQFCMVCKWGIQYCLTASKHLDNVNKFRDDIVNDNMTVRKKHAIKALHDGQTTEKQCLHIDARTMHVSSVLGAIVMQSYAAIVEITFQRHCDH